MAAVAVVVVAVVVAAAVLTTVGAHHALQFDLCGADSSDGWLLLGFSIALSGEDCSRCCACNLC